MSSITISFETQALDFSALLRGKVIVAFNNGSQTSFLELSLTQGISTFGRFSEEAWTSGIGIIEVNQKQAQNFATAFTRDYKNVGGTKNLSASVLDNVVTISSNSGTFVDGNSSYTGNVLVVGDFEVQNTNESSQIELGATRTNTGDCNNVAYTIDATGGVPPYVLRNGSEVLQSGWGGSPTNFNMRRGFPSTISVSDSQGNTKSRSVIAPSNISAGQFEVKLVQYEDSSDVLIQKLTNINGTDPLTYSLQLNSSTETATYQSSNSFSGVLPGAYKALIRDVYGCVVSKTIVITDFQDATKDENPRYFEIVKCNSIILSECPEFSEIIKKNPENTLSYNEISTINHKLSQNYLPTDIEPIQIKSSYPFHVITLHTCDWSKQDISPITLSENIGFKEKVDCKIFPLNGKTAVYFDGGNEYNPDTTTIIGASGYTTFPPEWAEEGQIIFIDGMGGFEIEGSGYNDERAKSYVLIDTVIASETDAKVQVSYNKQDYNLYHAYVDFSRFTNGYLVIEKGFDFENIEGNPWVSERLTDKSEEDELLIEWTDSRNKAGVVFSSGEDEPVIKFKKRKKGKFRPTWEGASEISDGDSRMYSLEQTTFERYYLEFPILTAREVTQLNIATGLDGFKVNNIPCQRTKYPDIEPLGDSNLYTWKCDLGYSGNGLAEQDGEIVLNPSTGNTGGGGFTKPRPVPTHDNRTRLNIDGGFVTVGGKFITID